MPSPSQVQGAAEEAFAEDALRARGYVVIERNWRGGGGEVDRIAWQDGLLCFIEIRSRSGTAGGSPEESVGVRKRRRIVRAARAYLLQFPPENPPMVRFDVVGIVHQNDLEPASMTLIPDAFDAGGRPR